MNKSRKELLTPPVLRKFNMASVNDASVCVFVGKPKTGKSFCVRDMCYHKRDFPIGRVMSGTERSNGYYKDFVPQNLIGFSWSPKSCDNFFKRQEHITEKKRSDPDFKFIDPRGFFILDDLMADVSWMNYKTIKETFMTGRHYHMLFVITMQYPLGIGPCLRACVDYVFLFRESIRSNRRRIYENFAGMFDSFELFCATMDKYTEHFGCIVIHNGSQSNRLEDQIFCYKAEDHGPFKMCDQMIWDIAEADKQKKKKLAHQESLRTHRW
jgi:hypothetical protein